MIYLVLKDLLNQKKLLAVAFLYILIFIFAFKSMGEGQLIATINAVAYLFIIAGGGWDEKNNSDVLLNSFPIKKSQIVGAKYLAMPIYVAIAVIIYGIFSVIFSVIGFSDLVASFSVSDIIIGLVAALIGGSFYYPVYFALGYSKSRYWYFILFFSGFFLLSTLLKLIPKGSAWLAAILEKLPTMTNNLVTWVIIGTAVLAVATFSYLISLNLYKRREF